MPMEYTIERAIIAALRRVQRHYKSENKWCQGEYQKTAYCGRMALTCYCLAGAIRAVGGNLGNDATKIAYGHFARILRARKGVKYRESMNDEGVVITWNDAKGRKFEEVTDLIKEVITALQSAKAAKAV